MKKIITIIDYGSGNLRSVYNALNLIDNKNYQFQISSNPEDLKYSDKIILPGVGAFADCIDSLSKIKKLIDILKEQILFKQKDFLGICVGMQLLADFGHEHEKKSGLGIIPGEIIKIDNQNGQLKIPHIGWNEIKIIEDHPILKNIKDGELFYFVHSYHFLVKNPKNIIAQVNYGQDLTAVIAQDNIIATQFHPEKSGESGIKLLKNFISS
jgi:glutamine amidotransferase